MLTIKNLKVSVGEETPILNGINLSISEGEVHAIMGPNGSGKSTLSLTIMGHPKYTVTEGSINFESEDIAKLSVDERARKGIFLAFQNPLEIEGVTLKEFLYQAYQAKHKNEHNKLASIQEFEAELIKNIKLLQINPEFVERSLNVGFSGGEKKRAEMLQLAMLQPKLVILDEIDSGLDVDALKIICDGLNSIKKNISPNIMILVITHYPRILQYLVPDAVHVVQNGTIKQSGTKELAEKIEKDGYSVE